MPRLVMAQLLHETNSFSVRKAGLEAFRERELLEGEAVVESLRDTNTELAGIIAGAAAEGWQVTPVMAAEATPCGPVEASTWRHFRDRIVAQVRRQAPVDAVLLALHGAMISDQVADADGALVAEVRKAAGGRAIVGCTLDLHANVSDQLADAANVLVPFVSYPHVDMRERGAELVSLAARALAGGRPWRSRVFRNRQLDGCDHGRSSGSVMSELVAEAAHASAGGGMRVGVCAGFPWADVFHAGPSVVVSGPVERGAAESVADPLLRRIWETRAQTSLVALDAVAACRRATELAARGRRVLIADFSDNPGGGGYGTTTALLRALLEQQGPPAVFAPLCDRQAAIQCMRSGVGSRVAIMVGAEPAAEFSGPPLALEGTIMRCGDVSFRATGPMWSGRELRLGPTAHVSCGSVDVVITSYPLQVTEPGYLEAAGVELARIRIIAIKSLQHFRAAFDPLVDDILFADSGGLVSSRLERFAYRNVRRPIWPLDVDAVRQ